MKYHYDEGVVHSVTPCTTDFGFSYWSLMVPPFKPISTLILGYGQGTIAELMKKVWGSDLDITGVDLKPCLTTTDSVIETDAQDYVQRNRTFDYVVVDLFNGGKVPEWVKSDTFLRNVTTMAENIIAFNSFTSDPLLPAISRYCDIQLVKEQRGNQIVFGKTR